MFLTVLSPIFEEFVHKPVAFMGGFVSGLLHLDLSDQPVSTWLEQQTGIAPSSSNSGQSGKNGKDSGPQSITID